jgi:glyoxylase-like metal-dependent hydrolase (beta-lactamase superfamily II)
MRSVGGRAVGIDVSAYVVRGIMIDSGFHRARHDVVDAVRALGVRGVIVTHYHEDHAGNAALLAARGVPMLMRADTETTLRAAPDLQVYRRVVWGAPPALATPLVPFDAGELAGVHTPGHSADHQVVWDPREGTLFSGDLWLGVRARILHSAEDPYTIIESLHRAAALSPARMFDAHRGLVDTPALALRLKAEWLTETLADVERRVREGWSDRAIVRDVLGGEEMTAYVSWGDYSRRNFVKAVRRRLSS